MAKRVTRTAWMRADTNTAHRAAELFGVADAQPPPGMVLVGWTWDYPDGSFGLVKTAEYTSHREQPVGMRPIFAPPA